MEGNEEGGIGEGGKGGVGRRGKVRADKEEVG